MTLVPVFAAAQPGRVCYAPVVTPVQKMEPAARTSAGDIGQEIYIPVWVHVVYANALQNISADQINSQIRILNEDYNRQNADSTETLAMFRNVAGRAHIHFYLARTGPDGHAVSGIERLSTMHGPFADNAVHYSSRGGHDAVAPQQYLNLWICDLADGVLGYGNAPGSVVQSEDGVVIDYAYVGDRGTVSAPYNKGRTATHETGHWLGLQHPWGTRGGCMDDDGISDTPQTDGPSHGCDLTRSSCGNLVMVQNFMDLSDDGCMNLFTKEQVVYMRQTLFANRAGVIHDDPGVITGTEQPEAKAITLTYTGNHRYMLGCMQPVYGFSLWDGTGRSVPYVVERQSQYGLDIRVDVPVAVLLLFRVQFASGFATEKRITSE